MAERLRYVDTASTAGGNGTADTTSGANRAYPTMAAAEAAEQANFDTANDYLKVLCRSSVGGNDTTVLSVSGSTTSATDYILFEGNAEFYRHAITNAVGIGIPDEYVRFKRIAGSLSASDATGREYFQTTPSAGGSDIRWESGKMFEVPGGGSGSLVGIQNTDADTLLKIGNSWFYDWAQGTARAIRIQAGTCYCYHNVCQNCDTGFYDAGGVFTVMNCIAKGCTDGFLSVADSSNYNCSDIASDAPGANSVTGSVTFVDEAGDDFHLSTSDTVANGVGTDLSADANYPISEDIDGLAFASWDGINMGSDQHAAAPGGGGLLKGSLLLYGVGL